MGPWVVDCFCASAGLVIELDGDSHNGRAEEDRRREEDLRRRGTRVLRIANDHVLKDADGVVEAVLRALVSETAVVDRAQP